MYLVDSNIWLEYLLNQDKSQQCVDFLMLTGDSSMFISEFSVYTIGIIATNKNQHEMFEKFLFDTFEVGSVNLISLNVSDLKELVLNAQSYSLDFDDAYQFTCAIKYNLTLVSFDKHFDKSPVNRKEPSELIA